MSRERVVRFLSEVINVEKFPMTVLDRPIESETCKIVENSYRATILAFLNEWSLFSETNGVDLIKVIKPSRSAPPTATSFSRARASGATASPRTGGWASGPTSI